MKSYLKNGEHCLSHIEGMPPVVVHDGTVVLLYCQDPATKNLVNKTKQLHLILQFVKLSKTKEGNIISQMYPQGYSVIILCWYSKSVNKLWPVSPLLF